MNVRDKLVGSVLGAALGDAMGMATETRSAEMIKRDFGGYVDELYAPPSDNHARGYSLGSVTDDFSLAYFTGKALARCKGNVTDEVIKESILTWAQYPQYYHFAGPTTDAAVRRLRGIDAEDPYSYMICLNSRATNGSGMKIFCVGLINPGNLDKAVQDTVTACMPTHPNDSSISAAAAISAAVAKAMTDGATLEDVLEAGLYGARKGFEVSSDKIMRLAVPRIDKRIKLAIDIAKKNKGWEETMLELADTIGSGLASYEAIPCVFGILAANPNDAFGAIKMAVNIGNDTDTIATMVGAVAGALYGVSNIPEKYIDIINNNNEGIDLISLVNEIEEAYYC